jgi:hypothetical protein
LGIDVLYRALGWLCVAMAIAVAVRDALAWWADGAFHLVGLGELWSRLDVASLSGVQTAVQRHLSASLWAWIARPVLAVPALAAFLVAAIVLFWLGRRRPLVEPHILSGTRPRRRRSRGALS